VVTERRKVGIQQNTARKIAPEVTKRLADDDTTHGQQGPRREDNVRNVGLKGWKCSPPENHSQKEK
jgi:hypothetical protein